MQLCRRRHLVDVLSARTGSANERDLDLGGIERQRRGDAKVVVGHPLSITEPRRSATGLHAASHAPTSTGQPKEDPLRFYFVHAPARLRHYAEVGGRAILRQWQGMLLLGLLVIGQATTILIVPASLLAHLGRGESLPGVLALAVLAALYVLPQRAVLRGGPLEPYVATLPISRPVRLLLDLTVLLVADALLVLELGLAVGIGGLAIVPGLIGLLLLVLTVQLAALHLPLPDPRRIARVLPLPAVLKPNLQALAEHPSGTGSRLIVALGLAVLAAAIAAAFPFAVRASSVAIAALALIGFVLADLYRVLFAAHAPIRAFLATLPVSPHHLLVRDLLTVLLLGSVPFLMLAVWFGVFDPGSLALFAGLAVAYAILLAALRLPVLRGGGLGVMLAALLAAGWAGSAIAMVLK